MFIWLFLSCSAILSLTRVCTLFFPPQLFFIFLFFMIWHVVLMQNKTGACGCECSIFQSVNDSVCVCVCVWMRRREQFTEVIGSPPVLWLHNIWAGSAVVLHSLNFFFFVRKPENTLGQFEFFLTLHWGSFSPSLFPPLQPATLMFISLLLHPCQYIYVHTEAKTSPDSGNSWHTLVA